MNTLVVKPVISEKSMRVASSGQYIFIVPMSANKIEIARTITKLFKVDVAAVRTVIVKGKVKRVKGVSGRRSDVKKAIVSVKSGQSIKIFDAEEEKPAKKDAKTTKKVAQKGDK